MSLATACDARESAARAEPAVAPVAGSAKAQAAALPPVFYNNALVKIPDAWRVGRITAKFGVNIYPNVETDRKTLVMMIIHPAEPMDPAKGLQGIVDAERAKLEKVHTNGIEEEVALAKAAHGGGGEVWSNVLRAKGARPDRYHMRYLDGGAMAQVLCLITLNTTPEQEAEFTKAFEEFVRTARLPSRIQLADAPPGGQPLTLYTVYRTSSFVEWLLDVPFTREQQDEITAYMVDGWKKNDRELIDGVAEIEKARQEIDALNDDKRELARRLAREEALKQWRAEAATDRMAKRMVDVYDGAHQPIAKGREGEPELTRQAADAALEAVFFMASQAAGLEPVRPDESTRNKWAEALAADYPQMPAEDKKELAEMPVNWATLRAAWPELPYPDVQRLTGQWAQAESVKKLGEQLKASGARAAGPDGRALANYTRSLETKWMTEHMSRVGHATKMSAMYGVSRSPYRYP